MSDIVPRSRWAGDIPPRGTPARMVTPSQRLWLHHGASGLSTVTTARAYVRHHVVTQGWQDVGYSFLVAEGKVLEGRGPGRQGAHTRGDNDGSHGVVLCGDYRRVDPAGRDIEALQWLLTYGHEQGWWPSRFTGGHRDAPGASTSCPGDRLHRRLNDINRPSEDIMATLDDDDIERIARAVWSYRSPRNDLSQEFHLRKTYDRSSASIEALRAVAKRVDEVATVEGAGGVSAGQIVDELAKRLADDR